jgi:hypothetical protein
MRTVRDGLAAGSLLAGLLAAGPAAAFLNDAEARKAVNDLREKVAAMEEATAKREAEASAAAAAERARLAEELATLRRSLLELNNQIVALRGEIARLGGANETLLKELAESQRRQRDVSQAFDERLKKIEPVKVAIDGREFMVEQEERRGFDDAFAAIRGGDFDRSVQLFTGFLRRFTKMTLQAFFRDLRDSIGFLTTRIPSIMRVKLSLTVKLVAFATFAALTIGLFLLLYLLFNFRVVPFFSHAHRKLLEWSFSRKAAKFWKLFAKVRIDRQVSGIVVKLQNSLFLAG